MTTMQIVGLTLICILAVQWGLAMLCLMRLFKARLPKKQFWFWNVFILIGVIVGPVLYLATERNRTPEPDASERAAGDNSAPEMPAAQFEADPAQQPASGRQSASGSDSSPSPPPEDDGGSYCI